MATKNEKEGKAIPAAVRSLLNESLHDLLLNTEVIGSFACLEATEVEPLYAELTKSEPWRSHLSLVEFFDILERAIAPRIAHLEDQDADGQLQNHVTAATINAIKADIKDFILSIPRDYAVFFPVPRIPRLDQDLVRLSKRIALVTGDVVTRASTGGEDQVSGTQTSYIRVMASGVGSERYTSTAVASAASHLKQFLQLVRGNRVLSVVTAVPIEKSRSAAVVVDVVTKSAEKVALPDAVATALAGLAISRNAKRKIDGKLVVPTGEELQRLLEPQIRVLDDSETISDVIRIKTALEWAFDSLSDQNQTLAFLQACIGLEALLGDDDKDEPLTTRLADRCAYLLGRGSKERDVIRKSFRHIYDVRSKLTHGRKARLAIHEGEQLRAAQKMLSNVIRAELLNLNAVRESAERAKQD